MSRRRTAIPDEVPEGAIAFIHIGKTGGTALKDLLLQSGDPRWILYGHTVSLPAHLAVHPRVPAVFFVRDPLARFVSAFNSRLREGRPGHYRRWRPEERAAFERFETATGLAEALSSDDRRERRAAVDAMGAIGHVKRPLAFYLDSREYLRAHEEQILYVGVLEDMAASEAGLRRALGISDSLALATDPVGRHASPDDLDRTLSPLAQDNLREWYAADFPVYAEALRLHLR